MSELALVLGILLATSIAFLREYYLLEHRLRQLLRETREKLPAGEKWDRFDVTLSPGRLLTVFVPKGMTQEEVELCVRGLGCVAGQLGQSLPGGRTDDLFFGREERG